METILTYRGYGIPTTAPAAVLAKARAVATLAPDMRHMKRVLGFVPQQKYYFYAEGSKYLYLPKHLAQKEFGPAKKQAWLYEKAAMPAFNGKLRPLQQEAFDAYMKSAKTGNDGIVSLHCGAGKTALALYIAAHINLKTLVIVNEENLGKQWEERIAQYLPGAKVGWIQRERCEIEGNDIVIGMLQTLAKRTFDVKTTLAKFGLVIDDECHTIGSEVYTWCLLQVCAPYMLGLSATPRRKDGLTEVMHWFLGPIVIYRQHAPDSSVQVQAVHYRCDDPGYAGQKKNRMGLTDAAGMMNQIASWPARNELIADRIIQVLEEPQRQILVLTQRRELQLDVLYELLQERGLPKNDIGIMVGRGSGSKKEHEATVEHAKTARVILATYHKAKQGLDIGTLNTLVYATPEKDIEQSSGRILRGLASEREIAPLIIDVVDAGHRNYANMWRARKKYYVEKGYAMDMLDADADVSEEEGPEYDLGDTW